MRIEDFYKNTAFWFIMIGIGALGVFWIAGWAVASFMSSYYGFSYDALRCTIPLGNIRLPFWPMASLFVLIMHGVFVFRYSILSAGIGIPERINGNWRGGLDAHIENPFVKVIAKDCVVVGTLLVLFLILCSCCHWRGGYWWGY